MLKVALPRIFWKLVTISGKYNLPGAEIRYGERIIQNDVAIKAFHHGIMNPRDDNFEHFPLKDRAK